MRAVWKQIFLGCALWAVSVAATQPALADVDFQVKKMTRGDVPLGKGQCDIRLRVDGEAEVSVRGDRVHIRTISGRDGRDDGSECNEPLPARPLTGFNFEVLDRRNDITLLSEPDRLTRFSAVVRIRDSEGGEGRYHFRLSWQMDGGGPGFGSGPGGYSPGDRGRVPDDRGPAARFPVARAMDVCRDEVRDRILRDYRYSTVDVQNVRADDRPGRNDWIIGDATGRSGRNIELFIFSCQVDFGTGRVRAVDVRAR
jgi:hypothetical protein